jgi:hypothetical protein
LKEDVLVNLFGIDILFLPTLMMPMPMPTPMLPILPMTVLVYRVLLVPMLLWMWMPQWMKTMMMQLLV